MLLNLKIRGIQCIQENYSPAPSLYWYSIVALITTILSYDEHRDLDLGDILILIPPASNLIERERERWIQIYVCMYNVATQFLPIVPVLCHFDLDQINVDLVTSRIFYQPNPILYCYQLAPSWNFKPCSKETIIGLTEVHRDLGLMPRD